MIRVAFMGPAGSGKTTLAHALAAQYGGTVVSFADTLRDEVVAAGYATHEELTTAPAKYTKRTLLQTWGDLRRAEDAEYFVAKMDAKLRTLTTNVFIDDLRFENEGLLLMYHSFFMVKLEGQNDAALPGDTGTHRSEHEWKSLPADLSLAWTTVAQRLDTLSAHLSLKPFTTPPTAPAS